MQGKDITVFGEGTQTRNLIFVEDAIAALIRAAQTDKSNGEAFFAVGDHHYSVATIAAAIVQYMGSGNVRFVEWPSGGRSVDVGDVVISNQKIKEVLDWAPQYDLRKGLIKTKAYYENCLEYYLR